MDKTFRFKSTTIVVKNNQISIKQLFLSEDFYKKDIMDMQMYNNQLLIQTRKNRFKIKYADKQEPEAEELMRELMNSAMKSKKIEIVKVNYEGGHPQMPAEGTADMDIRNNRILITTFQRTGQIDFQSIRSIRYENEVQLVKRLPNERLSLLNTLAVHLRSQPNPNKYYVTIDFVNALNDTFCAVFGGKNAKHAYDVLAETNRLFHGDNQKQPVKQNGEKKKMNNFTYYVPTRIHFGKGMISHLSELKQSGDSVLLVYGGGSIKRNGIYDAAVSILKDNDMRIYELSGVEPNPRIETVRKGVQLCKESHIDMVLAIGGGSVIDCSKAIAIGAKYDGDSWDLVMDSSKIKAALPIYTILTMAATGSEMDRIAVISNMELKIKKGTRAECMAPTMSILDPTYTYTVSKRQTAAGTADIMSHTLENYFTNVAGADVQARFAEGILKTVIHYGPIALKEPTNYNARANLMWAASQAINGILSNGAEVKWCVHPMEHELSAFYDITHGEGLAILTPVWMQYVLNEKTMPKFVEYGINVWNIDPHQNNLIIANQAIEKTADFLYKKLGCPRRLRDVGITDNKNFKRMAAKAEPGCQGSFVDLSKEDIEEIFNRAL